MLQGSVQARGCRRGFTLIELLVVVAIIALLISILLPALNGARRQARAVVCATNLGHVGKAMGVYLAESKGTYPASYMYPYDGSGAYDPTNQPLNRNFGYVHWSYFLYAGGQADNKAFQCPEFPKGGTPRTNPGPERAFWMGDQIDDAGNNQGSVNAGSREDRQAPWLAYTGNAAIFPRNKFTPLLSGGPRINRYVQEHRVKDAGKTILATEFNRNWKVAGEIVGGGGGLIRSKSHRPLNPFYHVGTGSNEYTAPLNTPGFMYGTPSDLKNYGLLGATAVEEANGVLENPGMSEMNAVGRHHPGTDRLGGSANFLYADSHVERKTVLQTLRQREWGSRYYSLTGENEVINRYGQTLDQP